MITGGCFKLAGHFKKFAALLLCWRHRGKAGRAALENDTSAIVHDNRGKTQLALVGNFSSEVHLDGSGLRLRCLKLLQKEQPLTIPEVATRLKEPFSVIELLFRELRAERLIEFSGTRMVGDKTRALFRVDTRHPSLELLLGPAPTALRHPEGFWGRDVF